MHFPSFNALVTDGAAILAKGPIALILLEDEVEVGSTIRHHLDAGFKSVITFWRAGYCTARQAPLACAPRGF